jgi:hypothetical protein
MKHVRTKEVEMRILRCVVPILFVAVTLSGQTQDLGQNVFFNDEGAIIMVVDAGVADRKLDSSYVMFMLFMAAKNSAQSISVTRDDVVMVYQGKEYKMPSLEEWRKNYKGAQNDMNLYARLGKESLALSEMRYYKFFWDYDFFPVLGRGPLPSDQLSLQGQIGAKTKLYFKNPGFKPGDELIIKVWDHKNPDLSGSCAVILK